jgi:hypothetical protein
MGPFLGPFLYGAVSLRGCFSTGLFLYGAVSLRGCFLYGLFSLWGWFLYGAFSLRPSKRSFIFLTIRTVAAPSLGGGDRRADRSW